MASGLSVLRIGVVDPPGAIDPRTMAEATTILLARQIFETPFLASSTGDAIPALFQEKLVEEGGSAGLKFATTVRRDARFSDGVAVTPEDVVAALAQDPVFTTRASASFRDGRVVLTLFAPNTRFDLFLTMCGMLYRQSGNQILGTGPYMLGPTDDDVVRLVRNPHARTPAKIDSIEIRTFPVDTQTGRPTALLAAIEKGEVDLAPRLSWRDINLLKNTAVVMKPVNSTCILYLNNERLKDVRLRSALAKAIDRTVVAEIAFGENPLAFRATGLLPPALGKTNDRLTPDLERARAEWQEAGGYSEPLSIVYSPAPRPYLPAPAAVARHLRDRFRRLGANVDASEVPSGDLIEKVNSGDYDLAIMGNIPDSPDPSDYLSAVVGSEAVPEGAEGASFAFNFSRYRSAEIDRLIAVYRKERRDETLSEIGLRLGQDVPLVPLMYGRACVAHTWRLRGFQPTVTGLVDLSALTLT
ncbi:MAG: ABC transporter substrate-binding protein [Vicinamibacteria bacterium]|nr:ABC transporter substrate-binding protein [Vicinamibacteria bacterium]